MFLFVVVFFCLVDDVRYATSRYWSNCWPSLFKFVFILFLSFRDLLFLINKFREKYKYEWTVHFILGLVISVIAFIPIDLEIKDTTDMPASYLDLHIEIDSEVRLRAKLYDKRDDFKFSHCELSISM